MPHYWLMNNSYSEKWDRELVVLMEHHNFTQSHTVYNINGKTIIGYISKYEAMLGDVEIWVNNHPYASFIKGSVTNHGNGRPSRQTIYLAHKKLRKDMDKPGWFCETDKRRNKTFEKLGI